MIARHQDSKQMPRHAVIYFLKGGPRVARANLNTVSGNLL